VGYIAAELQLGLQRVSGDDVLLVTALTLIFLYLHLMAFSQLIIEDQSLNNMVCEISDIILNIFDIPRYFLWISLSSRQSLRLRVLANDKR
jgi:hypothetical protein